MDGNLAMANSYVDCIEHDNDPVCLECNGKGWVYEKHDSLTSAEQVNCICVNEK